MLHAAHIVLHIHYYISSHLANEYYDVPTIEGPTIRQDQRRANIPSDTDTKSDTMSNAPVTESNFLKLFLKAMSHPEMGSIFQRSMEATILKHKEEIDQKMSSMQTTISEQENKIAKLEKYVDQMDQDSHINKIVISGIKAEKDEESNVKNIMNFIEVVMKVEPQKGDIVSALGIGQGSSTMLVTLSNRGIRDRIFKEKKNLRNNAKMVYINENLTQRRSLLFKKAHDVVRSKNITAAWTTGGNIFVKEATDAKTLKITHEKNLEKHLN